MSAFGRRSGLGGGSGGSRPAFGVARPMQGGGAARPSDVGGGDQFPPLDMPLPGAAPFAEPLPPSDGAPAPSANTSDAIQRLADRQASSGDAGAWRHEGFEASVHGIKEQVLPRLLERVDPDAAARLS